MGIFDFLTGKSSVENIRTDNYGRFLECNKPLYFSTIFKEATDLFKAEKYNESFIKFLDYVAVPSSQNVSYEKKGSDIEFTIIHGSAKIKGVFNSEGVYATSEIGQYSGVATALFRDLLTKNFSMNYNGFCVQDSRVYLKHRSPLKESSPMKLYYALKEMGLKADIHSQSLFDDFANLKESSARAKIEVPVSEKMIKIKYLKQWIKETFEITSSMSAEKDGNLMSHYLLALCYRIDFLLVPKGKVWKTNDMAVAIYSDKVLSQGEKIRKMLSYLKDILEMSDLETGESFFKTVDTFGLVNGSAHNDLVQFYLDQFKSAQYYVDLQQERNTMAVYEQALGYSLYFMGIYPAVKSLLLLYYRIFYPAFFEELGIKSDFYNAETKKFNKRAIENEISDIISRERKGYPSLAFLSHNLRYETPTRFTFAFLNEITYLNFFQPVK